ncbi:MAG: hypothetical protein HC853_02130 [Anaerolineae bacterium]|nr:hypothetical protein [Anaerolineae bacterium]
MQIPDEIYTWHKFVLTLGGINIDVQERQTTWAQLRALGWQLATPEQVAAFKLTYLTALGFDVIAYVLDGGYRGYLHGCDCDAKRRCE